MGLLAQALGRVAGSVADTAGGYILQNQAASIQSERDKAQALREENLVRLRGKISDESEIAKESRAQTAKDSETDPDIRVGGLIASRGQVRSAIQGNQAADQAQSEVATRDTAAYNEVTEQGPPKDEDLEAAEQIGAPTEKETGLINSRKIITSGKETALETKLAAEQKNATTKAEADKLKYEFQAGVQKQLAEMRIEAIKAQADARVLTAQGNKGAELELKRIELKIKGMDSIDKVLSNPQGTPPTEEQLARAETIAKEVGISFVAPKNTDVVPSTASIEQATKEINDKASWGKRDTTDFAAYGGDRSLAIKARAKEIEAEKSKTKPAPKAKPALTPEQARAALKARGKL